VLSREDVRALLSPFGVNPDDHALDNVLVYLDLLWRWNRRINLTSLRSAEDCITRHFGESFFLSRRVELRGRLLDIGSGAGFPGLALKLIASELSAVLLEPIAKKRAFLKEVVRACGLERVEVRDERLEQFAGSHSAGLFDLVTARAVGDLDALIPAATHLLAPRGRLCLWVGSDSADQLLGARASRPLFLATNHSPLATALKSERDARPPSRSPALPLAWRDPIPLPLSRNRVLLIGERSW